MTTFGDQVFEFGGMPVGGGGSGIIPAVNGKVYIVDYATGTDGTGAGTQIAPIRTITRFHDIVTSNLNNVAHLMGNSSPSTGAQQLTDTLTWSKHLTHILGQAHNRVSQRVSIRTSGSTVFTPHVNVTAQGCVFANFHTFYGFADNSAQVAWDEDGQRNAYYNVHFGGMGAQLAADHANSRVIVIGSSGNGEHYFKNCVFGLDTVDRGAANATMEFVGGSPRNVFEDCVFLMRADAATPVFITCGAGGIDRYALFRRCVFHNFTGGGGTTITQAMSINASAGGNFLMDQCWFHGCTDVENSASGVVFMNNCVVDTADAGLFVVNAPA